MLVPPCIRLPGMSIFIELYGKFSAAELVMWRQAGRDQPARERYLEVTRTKKGIFIQRSDIE